MVINVFASSSVPFIVRSVPVLIDRSDDFGFGLKTTLKPNKSENGVKRSKRRASKIRLVLALTSYF